MNYWVKKTKVGSSVAVNLSNKYRNDIISVKKYYTTCSSYHVYWCFAGLAVGSLSLLS